MTTDAETDAAADGVLRAGCAARLRGARPPRGRPRRSRRRRLLALVVVPDDFRWAILAVAAIGFAGASVTRGWAGLLTETAGRVPETRAAGVALAQAPRRLFAWPAFAAATLALWLWLDGSSWTFEIEAYVLPPAVGLLLFAVSAGVAAAAGRGDDRGRPVVLARARGSRGRVVWNTTITLFADVPDAVARARHRRRDRGRRPHPGSRVDSRPPGAVPRPRRGDRRAGRARAGRGRACRARTEESRPGCSSSSESRTPPPSASCAALRCTSSRPRPRAEPPSERARRDGTAHSLALSAEGGFAIVVPAIALGLAALAMIPSLDEPLVVALALAITGALHVVAAAWHRVPLAAATRWTALAGAIVAAAGSLTSGVVDTVELVSLPVAAALLGGATLAMWRRDRAGQAWPGGERIVWLLGLAMAVAPSIIAVPNDPRTWLVIVGALLAAIGCVVAPIDDATGLKAAVRHAPDRRRARDGRAGARHPRGRVGRVRRTGRRARARSSSPRRSCG